MGVSLLSDQNADVCYGIPDASSESPYKASCSTPATYTMHTSTYMPHEKTLRKGSLIFFSKVPPIFGRVVESGT